MVITTVLKLGKYPGDIKLWVRRQLGAFKLPGDLNPIAVK